MTTQEFFKLHGKSYWNAAFADKGENIILCGRTIRVFNCDEERFVQTLSKFGNALVAVSHSHETICIVNASSSKDAIILVEYMRNNGIFIEINRTSIKGINTDGGDPCFSDDDRALFFCTESRKIWRYTRNDGQCNCIYQVEHPEQWLSFDLYRNQLLITLKSPSVAEYCGFDILNCDGQRIKSFRYNNNAKVTSQLIQGKWLDADNFLILYPLSIQFSHDVLQRISWKSSDKIECCSSHTIIERPGKGCCDMKISPRRNFIAWIWMDMVNHVGRYVIGIYKLNTMEKIHECTVRAYMNTCFSDDDRYLFLCSEEFMRFDLATHFPKHS